MIALSQALLQGDGVLRLEKVEDSNGAYADAGKGDVSLPKLIDAIGSKTKNIDIKVDEFERRRLAVQGDMVEICLKSHDMASAGSRIPGRSTLRSAEDVAEVAMILLQGREA